MASSMNMPAQCVKSEVPHPDYTAQNMFTIANIVELYAAQFAQGYSNNQHQAVIRALLRHGAYEDGVHYHTNVQNGLHPVYTTFNPMEQTNQKDCLDGGISVLLRCPGFEYSDDITADGVTINVYVTPCQGHPAPTPLSFVLFIMPLLELAEPISLKGPNHVPPFLSPLIARLQCTALSQDAKVEAASGTCHLPNTWERQKVQGQFPSFSLLMPLLAIKHCLRARAMGNCELSFEVINKILFDSSSGNVRLQSEIVYLLTKQLNSSRLGGLSRATATLPWNLSYGQVANLAGALISDLKGAACSVTTKPKFPILSTIIHLLGIAILFPPPTVKWSAGALMASHMFMMGKKPTGQHTQPLTHSVHCPKVFMTPETHAVLRGECHNRVRKFQDALDATWHKFDKVSQTLVLKHHKSLQLNKINAWNAYSWKKNLMQHAANEGNAVSPKQHVSDVVKQNALEYQQLSQADKLLLIKEFKEFRNDKTTGMCITARSKVNDITHTLGTIKDELHHLKSHTSVEAIFYVTCSMTDLPLHGIAFATEGVEDFMGSVMGVEMQDVGLHKTINNKFHQCMVIFVVSSLRNFKWELGSIYWKTLMDGEYNKLRKEQDGQIECSEITELMHHPHLDKGTKQACCSTGESSHSQAKTYKSAATVETDDNNNEDPVNSPMQASRPLDSAAYPLHQGNEMASSSTQPP
ncbi:hypothetical protein BKA83DRAFT_4129536 [Pisolithus microcarpus]|nr:hypothetical protein BKA83DRAFT_4129536 [Pisolithus microcarpus]